MKEMEVTLLTRVGLLINVYLLMSQSGVFRPLKKKVSPLIVATASKLVLQRSTAGLQGGNTRKRLHVIQNDKIKD